jgi:F0F1-type ATP synthase membrane subunit a
MVGILVVSPFLLLIFIIESVFNYLKKLKPTPKQTPEKTYDQLVQEYLEIENKNRIKREKNRRIVNYGTTIFLWVLVPLLVIFLLWIIYDAGSRIGWLILLKGLLGAIGVMTLISLFVWGLTEFVDNYGSKIGGTVGRFFNYINPLNWGVTQMVGGMIYSAYKKVCPVINWEGDDEKTTELHERF